jgi:anti-sigma regulatory factor (Ser/Thr protein kinase)
VHRDLGLSRGDDQSSDADQHDTPALWAALAEASADGLVVVSPEGRILAANRRFGEVWGLPPDVIRSGDDQQALDAARRLTADPAGFIDRVQAIYADPSAPTHDEIRLRDGRVLDRYGTPLYDDGGTYLGWAWHFRDVSRQKVVEADLRRVSETLQASLLPPRPPVIPGLEVATRYLPAQDSVTVGGDFYDVFRLRTNDWGLVLGDVCGKGAQAAQLTALTRYTLRAASTHHDKPTAVLRELNDTLLQEPDLGERFASAIYASLELDACGAWLTLAVAGHPLPVVVRRAGWIDTRGQAGSLLGLFDTLDVEEDRVGLGPGDAIVFFTDGVTEARNPAGEEFSDEALPDVLLASTDANAEGLAEAIVSALKVFTQRPFADDVALLVVRVPEDAADNPQERLRSAIGVEPGDDVLPGYPVGEPHFGSSWRPKPPRSARRALQGDPTSAAQARRFITGVLHSWRMSELAGGDVELLTSELVGNAIRHGDAPFTIMVSYEGDTVRVEVGDGSPALPRRLQPTLDDVGGRGVHIVDEVASAWGVTRTQEGKRVWFELPVPSGAG